MSSTIKIVLALCCFGSLSHAHVEGSDPLKNIGINNTISIEIKDFNVKPNMTEVGICNFRNYNGNQLEGGLFLKFEKAPVDRALSFKSVTGSQIYVSDKENYSSYYFVTQGKNGLQVVGHFVAARYNDSNGPRLTVDDYKHAIDRCMKSAKFLGYDLNFSLQMAPSLEAD